MYFRQEFVEINFSNMEKIRCNYLKSGQLHHVLNKIHEPNKVGILKPKTHNKPKTNIQSKINTIYIPLSYI